MMRKKKSEKLARNREENVERNTKAGLGE